MKRIKLTLLAAVCALTVTALGAANASASGFDFDQYPASAIGTDSSAHTFGFLGGKTIGCEMGTFVTGSVSGPKELLPATVSPKGCSGTFEGSVTIKMNSCKFVYHGNVGSGSFDIAGTNCTGITLEGSNCSYRFDPQTGLATSFSNAGTPSTVTISDAASIQYTVTKGSKALCGSTTGTATYTGSWKLVAYNEGGSPTGVRAVVGTPLFMTGEASGEASKQPKFAAGAYPVTITGYQSPAAKNTLTLGGNRAISCAEVVNRSSAGAATASLSLSAEFSGCILTIFGNQLPTEFLMNSCSITLSALNVGPPYAGSFGVACSKEGDAIEIKDYNPEGTHICTYRLAPQSGFESVGLTNTGSGTEQTIDASYNVSGLTVTRVKGLLSACGGGTQKATYTGTTTFHGLQ